MEDINTDAKFSKVVQREGKYEVVIPPNAFKAMVEREAIEAIIRLEDEKQVQGDTAFYKIVQTHNRIKDKPRPFARVVLTMAECTTLMHVCNSRRDQNKAHTPLHRDFTLLKQRIQNAKQQARASVA